MKKLILAISIAACAFTVSAQDKGYLTGSFETTDHIYVADEANRFSPMGDSYGSNNYLKLDEPYKGETEVIHYLEMLKNVIGFDNIKKAVVKPLNRKIGAYYGCLLLRPSGVMAFDNPENPTIIEDFIKAIGGTPVVYPFRNECCGAYVSLKNSELPKQKSQKVLNSAKEKGAEEVITACPLCLYNLQRNGDNILPVKYFTELLAEALGV